MEDKKDMIKASVLNALWPDESDKSLERRQKFEKLHMEFLKSSIVLDLKELYRIIPESYGDSYDEMKKSDKDWRSLYCSLWELIPACGQKDNKVRNNQIVNALYQILVKNADFCQKGLIVKESRYVVLEEIMDILMAGWFKDNLGYPAILYDLTANMKDENLNTFYGRKAQLYICSYMMTKLSEEEQETVCTKEARQGIFGVFEQDLKRYISLNRKKEGKEPDLSLKEKECAPSVKECAPSLKEKESDPCDQDEVPSIEEGAKVPFEKGKKKSEGLLIFTGILFAGILLIAVGVFGRAYHNLEKENEKLKQEIQFILKEKEALEEKMNHAPDPGTEEEGNPVISTDGNLQTEYPDI